MLTALDIGWVAGFLEGEGSFQNISTPTIKVAQVEKMPIDKMVQLFGGSVYLSQSPNINYKPCWQWYIHGQGAIEIMMTLYVLMSPKRKLQIEHCILRWKKARMRRANTAKFCSAGHPLIHANVRVYRRKGLGESATGYRICRVCDRNRIKNKFELIDTTDKKLKDLAL